MRKEVRKNNITFILKKAERTKRPCCKCGRNIKKDMIYAYSDAIGTYFCKKCFEIKLKNEN